MRGVRGEFDFNLDRETLPKLQRPHDKIERSLFKIVFWTAGVIVLVVGLSIFFNRSFRSWQQRRLIAQANAFIDRGDVRHASLDARRLLQINPDSVEGARIMARIGEQTGARSAVEWRQRVISLGAASPDDLIALAQTAVRFGDVAAARSAINQLPPASKNTAQYHSVVADLALARRDGEEMERELNRAAELDPANKNYRFRLASLRLGASDPAVREKARQEMVSLQQDEGLRRDATRQLIRDALQRYDFPVALALARQLDGFPDKTFRDRLTLLTVLYEARDSGFEKLLSDLQKSAAPNPDEVGSLMIWLNTHQKSVDAVAWGKTLSPEALTQRSVAIPLADAYITIKDWDGLLLLVKKGNWGELDFLRNALSARGLRESGHDLDSVAQWNEAIKKVSPNAEGIMMLSETASKWGWRHEAIDLLWLASKDRVRGEAALQMLYPYFAKAGDTQNLYRVLLHLEELRPDDLDVQNNLAQVSLLLNLNIDHGQKLAREVYEREPKNAAYVSTYAYALYARGEVNNAIRVFSGLTEDQLRQPSIALYYGIILAATGDHDRAVEFLALGEKASLLPEEKALVDKAQRSLGQE